MVIFISRTFVVKYINTEEKVSARRIVYAPKIRMLSFSRADCMVPKYSLAERVVYYTYLAYSNISSTSYYCCTDCTLGS